MKAGLKMYHETFSPAGYLRDRFFRWPFRVPADGEEVGGGKKMKDRLLFKHASNNA